VDSAQSEYLNRELATRLVKCNDEIESLRRERDALRATLRERTIVDLGRAHESDSAKTQCLQCHSWWVVDADERHAPDCLAAPRTEERT